MNSHELCSSLLISLLRASECRLFAVYFPPRADHPLLLRLRFHVSVVWCSTLWVSLTAELSESRVFCHYASNQRARKDLRYYSEWVVTNTYWWPNDANHQRHTEQVKIRLLKDQSELTERRPVLRSHFSFRADSHLQSSGSSDDFRYSLPLHATYHP